MAAFVLLEQARALSQNACPQSHMSGLALHSDLENEVIATQCCSIFVKLLGMEKDIFSVTVHRRNGGLLLLVYIGLDL